MSDRLVSVITATLSDRRNLLETARASVAAQTYPFVEHVVNLDDPPSGDWGVGARLRALRAVSLSSEYIAYLDDDNAFLPDHLSSMVAMLERTGTDFVFSDDNRGIGNGRPEYGHIDTSTILHRRELLKKADWRTSGYAADWDIVERWLAAGATWAYTGQKTLIYKAGLNFVT